MTVSQFIHSGFQVVILKQSIVEHVVKFLLGDIDLLEFSSSFSLYRESKKRHSALTNW